MAANWSSVLTELIPLGLVIALSPLSIIPAILVLHSPRPRPAGLTFLMGWLLALAALTAVFIEVSGLAGGFGKPPKWASLVRIAVGAALIILGIYRWLTRHRSEHSPAWMRRISDTTPAKAGATAAVLAVVNPKVLFICAAAGVSIGTEGLGIVRSWLALLWFVLVAGSSVALPILAYAVSGDRLHDALTRLKDWMEKQHAVLVAAILVVIGVLVLYKGIHALK